MPQPSLGRIVLYTLSERDADGIKFLRSRAASIHRGVVAPIGDDVSPGETFPAIIVRVLGPKSHPFGVNLKVLLDGTDSYPVSAGAVEGDGLGTWHWPERADG